MLCQVLPISYGTIQINLFNIKLFEDCKGAKSDEGKKAAAILVVYSLSIDMYVLKRRVDLGKRVYFSKAAGKCSRYKLILNVLSKTISKQL